MTDKEKIMNRIQRDFTGDIYGNWKVIEIDTERCINEGRIFWICECQCGCGTKKSFRADVVPSISAGCRNAPSINKKTCQKCGDLFIPKRYGHNRRYCFKCVPDTAYENGASLRKRVKEWALEYKGEKCEKCGYNKCSEALEFHHLDPNEKDFSLSDRDLKLDWVLIKQELDKCILLCANCHRETHAQERKE